jgi:hypothetical protein
LGLAPQQIIDLDPIMLEALLQGLKDEAKEINDASKRKGRN